MELNWSTFILEIINFLVLLWILKRFLYQPILNVIAKRQQAIQASVNAAQQTRADAEALQQQYDTRLQQWQQERAQKLAELQQELAAERGRLQQALQDELTQQREKARVIDERERRETQRALETQAAAQAAQFAARLLQPLADPALEAQLLALAAQQWEALTAAQRAILQPAADAPAEPATVATAFALDEAQRQRWCELIQATCGRDTAVHFIETPALLAGARITVGAHVLGANLRDELKAFAEAGL